MITQQTLKAILNYCQETGVFTWLFLEIDSTKSKSIRYQKTWNSRFAGKVAGTIHHEGYIQITIEGNRYMAHRLAWLYMYGAFPKDHIDHINGNRSDNTLYNLREATNAQNLQNQRMPSSNNKSGFLGVSLCKLRNKYQAVIMVSGKYKHLGYYDTPEEAHEVYLDAKRENHSFCTI